jgi:hypothetical protein
MVREESKPYFNDQKIPPATGYWSLATPRWGKPHPASR